MEDLIKNFSHVFFVVVVVVFPIKCAKPDEIIREAPPAVSLAAEIN